MEHTKVFDLQGRIAFVTGAGQGVGLSAAKLLASNNAGGVVINDFHKERAEEASEAIRSMGVKSIAVQADVGNFDQVQAGIDAATKEFGSVDILVNNAGNAGPTSGVSENVKQFWETSPDDWALWLHTNLYGVMMCSRAAMPGMIERKYGRIVNVISDAGRVGEPHLAAYSAAKGGTASFSRAIAKAGARYGICVNNVSLGPIYTPGVADSLDDPERKKQILKHYLVRRYGTTDDAAAAILYLASEAAGWVTGQTLPVNGGYSFAM